METDRAKGLLQGDHMKKYLSIVFIFAIMVAAPANALDPRTLAKTGIKMAVISQDGKRVGDKFVTYAIFKVDKKWEAVWDEVNFYTVGSGRRQEVGLFVNHYSTDGGEIKNVKVSDDFASFDIETRVTDKISIRVICRPPKEYLLTPTIRAVAVYPNRTDEWVLTERIVLPSTEINGNPLPGEKNTGKGMSDHK
jgi:hypothetical protein